MAHLPAAVREWRAAGWLRHCAGDAGKCLQTSRRLGCLPAALLSRRCRQAGAALRLPTCRRRCLRPGPASMDPAAPSSIPLVANLCLTGVWRFEGGAGQGAGGGAQPAGAAEAAGQPAACHAVHEGGLALAWGNCWDTCIQRLLCIRCDTYLLLSQSAAVDVQIQRLACAPELHTT